MIEADKQEIVNHVRDQADLYEDKMRDYDGSGGSIFNDLVALSHEGALLLSFLVEKWGTSDPKVDSVLEEMKYRDHARTRLLSFSIVAKTLRERTG